jgi:hypothetical protein
MKFPKDHEIERLDKPSLPALQKLVTDAVAGLNKKASSKSGKKESYFAQTMTTLNEHSYLLELLNRGDTYTSIFTGSFFAIVKVCPTTSLMLVNL